MDDVAQLVQLIGANDSEVTREFTKQAREVLAAR
jgi:hypothetical protein